MLCSHHPRAIQRRSQLLGKYFQLYYLLEHLPDNPRQSPVLEGSGCWNTKDTFSNQLHLLVHIHPVAKKDLCFPKSGSEHTTEQKGRRSTSNAMFLNRGSRETQDPRALPCCCRSNTEHLILAAASWLVTLSCHSCAGTLLTSMISFTFTSRKTDTVRAAMKMSLAFSPVFTYLVLVIWNVHSPAFC